MLTTAGLMLAAYGQGHSPWRVSAVLAARALPVLLLGPWAGQLADRFDRKRLMIMMDGVRAILIALIPAAMNLNFLVLLVLALLATSATITFNPARSAVLPDLVPESLLGSANALIVMAERTSEVLAFGAAGILIVLAGVAPLFTVDAATFILSAVVLGSIEFPSQLRRSEPGSAGKVATQFRDGLAFIAANRELDRNGGWRRCRCGRPERWTP